MDLYRIYLAVSIILLVRGVGTIYNQGEQTLNRKILNTYLDILYHLAQLSITAPTSYTTDYYTCFMPNSKKQTFLEKRVLSCSLDIDRTV